MHVLVIEGYKAGHSMLKELGCEISMIIEEFRISGNEENFYDRYITVSNGANINEWIEAAKIIDQTSKVNVIINFHENRQLETSHIANYFGLQYHSFQECMICKDKILMRRYLQEKSFDFIKGDHIDTVWNYVDNSLVKFPIILKPRFGWASKNIYIVYEKSELREKIEVIKSLNQEFCFEEFIDGVEYSVETFSQNGVHKVVAVTEKIKNYNFIEIGHIVPAKLSHDIYMMIYKKIIGFLELIEHKDGPMHTEIMVNEDVHIIETHLRMGGDNIPELIKIVSGFDMTRAWAELVMGETNLENVPEIEDSTNRAYIDYVISTDKEIGKKFIEVEIDSKLLPFLLKKENNLKRGEIIPYVTDSFSRIGCYIYNCEDGHYDNVIMKIKEKSRIICE